jgi:endogenous inhibitor of DNA gyrase (YacG/DUF329 family)
VNVSSANPATVKCPNCGTLVEWSPEQPWRPFCSERCKLVDLGSWFDEQNRIAGNPASPSSPEQDD